MGIFMKERNQTVDAVKGMAAILVMIGHCIVLNQMEDGLIYDMIKSVQMPLFMIVSGYLMIFTKEIQNWSDAWIQIKKRAAVCLVPFFVWTILLHPFSIPESLGLVLFQLDKGLWFLMVLFLLSLVMVIARFAQAKIQRATDNTWPGLALFFGIWAVYGVILVIQTLTKNTFLSPHLILYYCPFFMGGYLFGMGSIRIKMNLCLRLLKSKTLYLATLLLLAILFFILNQKYDMVLASNKKELVIQLLSSALGSVVIILVIAKIKGKFKKLLSLIGRYTLEIYVIHYHFANLLWKNSEPIAQLGPAWCYRVLLSFVLMSVITVPVIYLLKKIKLTDTLLFGQYFRYQ